MDKVHHSWGAPSLGVESDVQRALDYSDALKSKARQAVDILKVANRKNAEAAPLLDRKRAQRCQVKGAELTLSPPFSIPTFCSSYTQFLTQSWALG